jgi:hypothetical protein
MSRFVTLWRLLIGARKDPDVFFRQEAGTVHVAFRWRAPRLTLSDVAATIKTGRQLGWMARPMFGVYPA